MHPLVMIAHLNCVSLL